MGGHQRSQRTVGWAAASVAAALAGGAAWSVRGRASNVFCPSRWRGNPQRRTIALTFDDGPSESTTELLRVIEQYSIAATFFQCGAHIRRLPEIAQAAAKALIRSVANRPIDEKVIADTAERIAMVRASEEGKEGVAAFLKKRSPAWVPDSLRDTSAKPKR